MENPLLSLPLVLEQLQLVASLWRRHYTGDIASRNVSTDGAACWNIEQIDDLSSKALQDAILTFSGSQVVPINPSISAKLKLGPGFSAIENADN